MPGDFAVIAAGAMGSAVGRRLADHGARVLTSLVGRSAATARRAADAAMIAADDDALAGAEIILSIVPPAEAVTLAERLAPILAGAARKPVFVDFNAINVATKRAVAATIEASGAVFADGAIIGLPPQGGEPGPRFYVAGPGAAAVARLSDFGLDVRVMDGAVGAAAALKMSYAGITKGLTAIATAMVLAATRAGSAEALHAELAASQPQLLARFGKALPDMVPKAYRWVAEMDEIAAFAGADGARAIYTGAAEVYRRIAEDERGPRTEIAALEAFLKL